MSSITSYTVTNLTLSKMSGINEWDGKKLGFWMTFSLPVTGYALTKLLSFSTVSSKLNISLQCTFVEVNCTKGRWLSALAGAAGRGLTGAGLETGISWELGRAESGIIWDSSLLAIPAIITTRPELISEALDNNKQLSFRPAPLTCLWMWIILLLHCFSTLFCCW